MEVNSEKIKELRDKRLWSQDELSIAAGTSLRTIQRAEREGVASLQTVKALAAALQVDVERLRLRSAVPNGDDDRPGSSHDDVGSKPLAPELTTPGRARFKSKWVWAALAMALAGVVLLVVRFGLESPRPQSLSGRGSSPEEPVAKKILGHWESISTGVVVSIDADGTRLNPRGGMGGNLGYTMHNDVISYGQADQIVSARVTFESPEEMVWTTVETGAVIRWSRKKLEILTQEELVRLLEGRWRGTRSARALEIKDGRVKLTMMDGAVIESAFLLQGQRLTINRGRNVYPYVVSFDTPERMSWTSLHGPDSYIFLRLNSL